MTAAARRGNALILLLLLGFACWWRGHTFAPTVRELIGFAPWPVVRGETEPLDCDEAIYAYIGKRLVAGDVMYRDLTENKPPGGYWLYALAVALGGANEFTIRLMPIPLVLATIALIWWLALRLGGPFAAIVAGFAYILLSTDPYLYGNGMQLEQPINVFATAALALVVAAGDRQTRGARPALLLGAGLCTGAAALVRPTAALHGVVFAVAALRLPRQSGRFGKLLDPAALAAGFLLVWIAAGTILATQGALADAYDDVIRYGRALVTDTPAEPHTPPFPVRWITGNADPAGNLPPPFGRTDYLVWWGTGTWPLWLTGALGVLWLMRGPEGNGRRLVACWTLSAWLQVALPRQFWAHYYLTPTPGLALAGAVLASDALGALRRTGHPFRRINGAVVLVAVMAAPAFTAVIQVRDYLLVPARDLTIRYKGGGQWVVLRDLGRALKAQTKSWNDPHLYVWGIQSPLYVYSGLDGVTRQVFADNLIRAFADTNHPLIRPRIERTLRDLEARRPVLVFAGYPPFKGLRDILQRDYVPLPMTVRGRTIPVYPNGMGLWVERSRADAITAP